MIAPGESFSPEAELFYRVKAAVIENLPGCLAEGDLPTEVQKLAVELATEKLKQLPPPTKADTGL